MVGRQCGLDELWIHVLIWVGIGIVLCEGGCERAPDRGGLNQLLHDLHYVTAIAGRGREVGKDVWKTIEPQEFGRYLLGAIEGHVEQDIPRTTANAECHTEAELTGSGNRWSLAIFDAPDGSAGINYRCLTRPGVYGVCMLDAVGGQAIDEMFGRRD